MNEATDPKKLTARRGQAASPGMDWRQYAFERMIEANPFPSAWGASARLVGGRLQPQRSLRLCRRQRRRAICRRPGDRQQDCSPLGAALSSKRIAVVGGGPTGLAATHFLRREGHAVTIFEAHDQVVGMMRFGNPGYSTARERCWIVRSSVSWRWAASM